MIFANLDPPDLAEVRNTPDSGLVPIRDCLNITKTLVGTVRLEFRNSFSFV